MRMFKILHVLLVRFAVAYAATNDDMFRLHGDLLQNYISSIRPIQDQSKNVEVQLTYVLEMVIDLDERRQVLSTNGWFNVYWHDHLLRWNKSDYGGIERMWLKQSEMWLPDITLYNRIGTYSTLGNADDLVPVASNGDVIWAPQVQFDTRCDIDITMFPFDKQRCTLFVTTDRSSMDEILLRPLRKKCIILSPNFQENGGWKVVSTHSTSGQGTYNGMNFSDITLFINFRRRQLYFIFNTIIPIVMLSVLNTVVFTLRPESGEKMSLSITVLLSVGVFLTMIVDNTPKTSQTVSIMAVYLVILLTVNVSAIFLSAFSLSLFHKHPKRAVPFWLKAVLCRGVGRKDGESFPAILNPLKNVVNCMAVGEVADYVTNAPRVPAQTDDCTWHDVTMSLDRVFFWVFLGFTVVVTTTVLSIMLTSEGRY